VRILITNDDGVLAPALRALREALAPLGEVTIVAPDRDQSATSHALTLSRPFRIQHHEPGLISVDGTPTDCVITSFYGLLENQPDLVISGINIGPNMGEDVFYSGTVAAAIEGALQGVPAMAVSFAARPAPALEDAAGFVARIAARLLERPLPRRHLLNVNLPAGPWEAARGVRVTRLGSRIYHDTLIRKVDPRGRAYYWIGGEDPEWESIEGADRGAGGMEPHEVAPGPGGGPDPFAGARERMVQEQIRARGVRDPRVLEAMSEVPRHLFLPRSQWPEAYLDSPLPVGSGQTISQPYIVARMLELAELAPEHRVLEIGTGTAYQTALLERLVGEVFTIERLPELAEIARRNLAALGRGRAHVRVGDGTLGWQESAPFDRMLVAAAAPRVPEALKQQLGERGVLVIPVGDSSTQRLEVWRRTPDGDLDWRRLGECRFVPLLGRDAWREDRGPSEN
jgi:5'/3'-nucleotidase SurE/protein-L-isoaspartate(D-aspartate) O-methyltransferase